MTLVVEEQGCTEQLARFFPKLSTLRIPVRVQPARGKLQEATIVEFGTEEFAIFSTTLPLEFDDRVRITRNKGSRTAEAAVIALQYHAGRKAVAVRFLDGRCDWMMNP